MAPLPPDGTPRFRFFYTVIGRQHSLNLRSTQSPSAMGGWVNNFLLTFANEIFSTTLDYATFAPTGSDVFNIVTMGYEGHVYGLGLGNLENTPWAYTFVGRTPGGRRNRISQYGAKSLSANYRFTPGENSVIDAVVNVLAGSGGVLQGIDSLPIQWKNYANVQVNDHWVKRVRP